MLHGWRCRRGTAEHQVAMIRGLLCGCREFDDCSSAFLPVDESAVVGGGLCQGCVGWMAFAVGRFLVPSLSRRDNFTKYVNRT